VLAVVVMVGTAFYLWPETLPDSQVQKLIDAAAPCEVVIIFNPGGWGNATLAQAKDFTPVLAGIQQTLAEVGLSSVIIPYGRTPSGFNGQVSDVKAFLYGYEHLSQGQADDITRLSERYPNKYILLTGFSNGGGMTAKVMEKLGHLSQISAIIAGVPGWFPTGNGSPDILVLNNHGRDPLASTDLGSIAVNVIKAPYRWIKGKIDGEDISIGTAFQFPGHDYPWTSEEVGPAVRDFLHEKIKLTSR